jgi:hypothetical protein
MVSHMCICTVSAIRTRLCETFPCSRSASEEGPSKWSNLTAAPSFQSAPEGGMRFHAHGWMQCCTESHKPPALHKQTSSYFHLTEKKASKVAAHSLCPLPKTKHMKVRLAATGASCYTNSSQSLQNNLDVLELRKRLPTTISLVTFQHHATICIPGQQTKINQNPLSKPSTHLHNFVAPPKKNNSNNNSFLLLFDMRNLRKYYQIKPAPPFREEKAPSLAG